MQVGVHQPRVDPPVADQVAGQGDGLLDEPARDGGRWCRQRVQQALHLAAQPGQLGRGGAVQPAEQVTDRGAGVVDRDVVQVAVGVEPLQQHGPGRRVGREQAHRAVAAPQLQGQVLVPRLRVRPGDLEDGRLAAAAAHRQHERAHAVPGRPVRGQLPALQRRAHQPGQPVQPRVAGLEALRGPPAQQRRERLRYDDRARRRPRAHGVASPGNGVGAAPQAAAWACSWADQRTSPTSPGRSPALAP